MANERDEKSAASTIWRTVVFAGAMLGAPLAASADQPPPPRPPPQQNAAIKPAPPKADPARDKARKIEAIDGERKALLAKLVEAEPKDLDALRRDIVAKDVQIKKLVDELVAMRKPRPRTPVVSKPMGRGFVLA